MGITRRKFLGAASKAVVVGGTMASGKVFGANNRIRVATIGFHGQGRTHIRLVMGSDLAEVVALCDVDEKVLDSGAKWVKKGQGKTPAKYTDIRALLDNDEIDAVTIATPNHWHALAAVWACQAGKDVYVEKPLSHNVWEGGQVAAAAKKHGRVVQHGSQSRSDPVLQEDIEKMHDGIIGDIVHSRGYVYKTGNRAAIGHGRPADPPAHLNWTLWQGPAREEPYRVKEDGSGLHVHYNWHWFWKYGDGEMANQGIHEMDLAVWGHNRGLPIRVASQGGRYAWDDDGETPNTQATSFTYEDGSLLTFEVRNLGSFQEAQGGAVGNSFFGTEGYYVRDRGFFDYKNKLIGSERRQTNENVKRKLHMENFLEAVRDQNPEHCNVQPEEGHISCAHCHLGNMAYRLGRTLEFDTRAQRIRGDDEANALLTRQYREGFKPDAVA